MKLDLKKKKLREINSTLQNLDVKKNERDLIIINPEGSHALCAGLNQEMKVLIKGHVGYYCAGMNQKAHVTILLCHPLITSKQSDVAIPVPLSVAPSKPFTFTK